VREISLPVFKKLLAQGLDRNHAAAVTLLHLIAHVEDTNLLHRGGPEGAAWARAAAAELLQQGSGDEGTDSSTPLCSAQNDKQETLALPADDRVPSLEEIAELDRQFIARNLSPGGCADLLAVTLFLESLSAEF
jgi:triphosphoribosyl-dephospho-CoA synthetase